MLVTISGFLDQEILNYYLSNRKKFLENAIEPDEEVPEISTVGELNQILETGPSIFIDDEYGEDVPVELSWGVTFDDEHGLTIRIDNGEIVSVGPH